MAIYHLKLTPVTKAGTALARSAHHGGHRLRSGGALGKAAYLAGERLVARDGPAIDYRAKAAGVEHSQLILPGGGTTDREQFWNAVDRHPTQRETATVARDLVVAFPHELSFAERRAAAVQLGRWIADRYSVAVDLGMHTPELAAGSDARNSHGHFLISERQVSPTGELGYLNRELNQLACRRRDPKRGRTQPRQTAAAEIRVAWQEIANAALERGGHAERIDCRSYREQGSDRLPTEHRGAAATRRLRAAARAAEPGADPERTERPVSAAQAPASAPEESRRQTGRETTPPADAPAADLNARAEQLQARQQAAATRLRQLRRQQRSTPPIRFPLAGLVLPLPAELETVQLLLLIAIELEKYLDDIERGRLQAAAAAELAELRHCAREQRRLRAEGRAAARQQSAEPAAASAAAAVRTGDRGGQWQGAREWDTGLGRE